MKLIGIDFSLNSPSICFLVNDKIKIVSITRDEHDRSWFLKKKNNPYPIIEACSEVKLVFTDKIKHPSDYIQKERSKVLFFEKLTDLIIDQLGTISDDTYIAMEGISFGSSGNTLIDISMATHSLRSKLITKLKDSNRFFVFSPGTIKNVSLYKEKRLRLKATDSKYALKGSAKKWEMYEALVDSKDPIVSSSEYVKLLRENSDWILPSLVVKKPLDDINDSVWACLTLKTHLSSLS
jgi:hypothetical protein